MAHVPLDGYYSDYDHSYYPLILSSLMRWIFRKKFNFFLGNVYLEECSVTATVKTIFVCLFGNFINSFLYLIYTIIVIIAFYYKTAALIILSLFF